MSIPVPVVLPTDLSSADLFRLKGVISVPVVLPTNLSISEIFLDTSAGIRRMERNKQGDILRKHLSTKKLFTSSFVLMEFKRTVLRDAISLYNILKEGTTVDDIYYKIHHDLANHLTENVATRWVITLGILGYPRDKDIKMFKRSLENFIRKGLISTFLKNVQWPLLPSCVNCSSLNNRPNKIGEIYELDIKCDCSFQNVILSNINIFRKISIEGKKSHEYEVRNMSDTIDKLLLAPNSIREEYCKALGDVIIAIDCPDKMEMYEDDHHFDLICNVISKRHYRVRLLYPDNIIN